MPREESNHGRYEEKEGSEKNKRNGAANENSRNTRAFGERLSGLCYGFMCTCRHGCRVRALSDSVLELREEFFDVLFVFAKVNYLRPRTVTLTLNLNNSSRKQFGAQFFSP